MTPDSMDKLKILFICPYQPDLIRVRPYQLIRHLVQAGHKVTLVYYDSPGRVVPDSLLEVICEDIYAFPLSKIKALSNCVRALPSNKPIQLVYGFQPDMERKIHALLQENGKTFDIIHFEHIRTAIFAQRLISQDTSLTGKCVWDSVDSITHLFRQAAKQHPRRIMRQFMKMEARRTARFEAEAPRLFKYVLVTSQKDKDMFAELQKGQQLFSNITVLPNGVDLEYFHPNSNNNRFPDTLVISGKMSYHANESMVHRFISAVLPLIWIEKPETKLMVVGQNPSPRIQAYTSDARIQVTGWVEDMRPYLQTAALAVAPLPYGAGIQNKVLEAMACETAVVASSLAAQALQAKAGLEILVADNDNEFACKVLELLNNPSLAAKIGAAGRKYVEREHSWSTSATQLIKLYRNIS